MGWLQKNAGSLAVHGVLVVVNVLQPQGIRDCFEPLRQKARMGLLHLGSL
jgi:hypothetical protein